MNNDNDEDEEVGDFEEAEDVDDAPDQVDIDGVGEPDPEAADVSNNEE